jgi:hypothetical protein
VTLCALVPKILDLPRVRFVTDMFVPRCASVKQQTSRLQQQSGCWKDPDQTASSLLFSCLSRHACFLQDPACRIGPMSTQRLVLVQIQLPELLAMLPTALPLAFCVDPQSTALTSTWLKRL